MQYAYIWDGLDAYNMMQLYGRTHACANGGGRLPASCAFARGVEKGGTACEPLQTPGSKHIGFLLRGFVPQLLPVSQPDTFSSLFFQTF